MHAPGLFDSSDHLAGLPATGDPLEALDGTVDLEVSCPVPMEAPGYAGRLEGTRPPCEPVVMSRVLVLASMHDVSDERMALVIRDRFSWLRFLGFRIGERTADHKTIRLFREKLTQVGAFKTLLAACEGRRRERGHGPTGGRIVDATPVSAPRRPMTKEEEERAGAGEGGCDIWPADPAGAAPEDTDARWTVRHCKARTTGDGRQGTQNGMPDLLMFRFPIPATGPTCPSTAGGALSVAGRAQAQRATMDMT